MMRFFFSRVIYFHNSSILMIHFPVTIDLKKKKHISNWYAIRIANLFFFKLKSFIYTWLKFCISPTLVIYFHLMNFHISHFFVFIHELFNFTRTFFPHIIHSFPWCLFGHLFSHNSFFQIWFFHIITLFYLFSNDQYIHNLYVTWLFFFYQSFTDTWFIFA